MNKNFANFVRLVQKRRKENQNYTPEELIVERELENRGLKKGIDFYHNFRIKQPKGYFWLDFYLPKKRIDIEVNGKIWHKLNLEKDKRRDAFLKRKRITVVRINSDKIRDKSFIKIIENLFREKGKQTNGFKNKTKEDLD